VIRHFVPVVSVVRGLELASRGTIVPLKSFSLFDIRCYANTARAAEI